jgi:hypothetical protein
MSSLPSNYRLYLYLFFGLLFFLESPIAKAQSTNFWSVLAKVKIKQKTDPKTKQLIEYPVFGEELKPWNGKEIKLKGYIVPLQEMRRQNYFVLSSLPFSSCFFCGGAGPETVIEVYLRKDIPFTDQAITLKGKLQLNDSQGDKLMYILRDAEKVEN